MVQLPYRSESQVSLPQVVRSYGNGKIPNELMQPCGIRNFTMVEPAARACRAMVAAAAADGIAIDATGTYRTYDQQVQLFTQRYSATPIAGRKTKKWNGATYWQKPNVAMAATPGTSKHGLGVTADFAQRNASGKVEGIGPVTLSWMAAHGPSFGFWNSVKSEAWHWPYFLGDDIPQAVLDMEANGAIRLPPPVPSNPDDRERFYLGLPREGVLSKGARGLGVEAIQWALTRAGFATGIDGTFGPATERAVREFQAAKKLTVDGLVGAKTWAALGLLADGARPPENVPPPEPPAPTPPPKPAAPSTAPPKPADAPQTGALAAATAAYRAGFRGDDLTTITCIAGRESGWRSDQVNPRTSDRGMWQINWKNLQGKGYDGVRAQLGITADTDLLDLDKNAGVAFFMYEDSVRHGEPWFPWRGSETGHDGSGPGWDPKGQPTWRTEKFADEAAAAAKAVLAAGGAPPASAASSAGDAAPAPTDASVATYTITADDADGFIAIVGRCLGIGDAPWAVRHATAEAIAAHNGATLDKVWKPGDTVAFPAAIDGVRAYTIKPGDGLIAIAKGLGLGRSAAAQEQVTAINAWQGATPHAGATWYGGAA